MSLPENAVEQFSDCLTDSLIPSADGFSFIKLSLAKYRGSEAGLNKISVRVLEVKGQPQLSFTYHYQTRDVTKNFRIEDGLAQIQTYLDQSQVDSFKSAYLRLQGLETQLLFNKKNEATIQTTAAANTAVVSQAHDREKNRFIDIKRPFLTGLGVTDAQQKLIPAMSRKWKQINKFIEVFQHAFESLKLPTNRPVHVVDFGAGKGYLTFAIHDFLRETLGYTAQVTGVELRDELVKLCGNVVNQLSIQGLDFYQGDVRSYHPEAVDVMIALHACDVATDYALHTGVRLGASIIMCAPCCHKQVRPQIKSPQVLRPMLQHGVHLGQEAEMLTDGLRALLLEACGYETKVFEFVALEHTSKNKMILAIKRESLAKNTAKKAEILSQIESIKAFYGIREQCLESLLMADGLL
ncbi:class I SAM-dependent methyltransferase [Aquirhabdus parva]|uniref:Methyltransferase n=1 Tax=Aquirhabdus parva TaxID=2283318 RepID=A0A345PAI2_9GAMM|nr:SAM-dependent methyltransferase [Aquirhabdus parva]AXI04291.1 methyltransferase [Aquirhabdus parva]